MDIQALIARAVSRLGSQAAVAREIGVLPHRLTEWKQGTRQCPPERIDQLAELAGLDHADQVRAVWEAVRRSMGKTVAAVLAGVLVTLATFGANDAAASAADGSDRADAYRVEREGRLAGYHKAALMYLMSI